MRLSLQSNIKEFTRGLTRVQKRQIPFATKNAITDTAFAVRKRIVERTWPRSVEARNKRFAGTAFRVEKASKSKLQARVFDRLGREALSRQALGQIRRARRSAHLAIPTGNVKRTRSGKIRKRDLPASLRNNPKAFTVRARGREMILERATKRRYPLRPLYGLKSSARVPKSFPFHEDAKDTSLRAFPNFMRRRLAHALRTAR